MADDDDASSSIGGVSFRVDVDRLTFRLWRKTDPLAVFGGEHKNLERLMTTLLEMKDDPWFSNSWKPFGTRTRNVLNTLPVDILTILDVPSIRVLNLQMRMNLCLRMRMKQMKAKLLFKLFKRACFSTLLRKIGMQSTKTRAAHLNVCLGLSLSEVVAHAERSKHLLYDDNL